jgi:SAM-dependent methyltransferase
MDPRGTGRRAPVTEALSEIYESRFNEREATAKTELWREIVAYLSRWIDPTRPVLDVACDRGYFLRWVTATERWATDIRDVRASLPEDVHFVRASALELEAVLGDRRFGTIFMSNYLEHLDSGDVVVEQLRVAARLLEPGGRLIVLQPNIRLVGERYWDFIDHHVALTERSLVEAAELASLRTVKLIPRFLPYSTKGRLPVTPWLVRAYLRFPPAWWFMGKQTLYVGTPG